MIRWLPELTCRIHPRLHPHSPFKHSSLLQAQYVRRAAQPNLECITLLMVTEYEPGTSGPKYEWNCQLLKRSPASNGRSGKILKIQDLGRLPKGIVEQFESARSLLIIPGGTVGAKNVQIPVGADIRVEQLPNADDSRRLATGNVNKKVLVVRVNAGPADATTTASAAGLSDSVFGTSGDPVNLASQYEACSYGKLTFSPLTSLNEGDPALDAVGVYEVNVTTSTMDHAQLREAITDKLNIDWPNTTLPERSWDDLSNTAPFDHVMYCMPPGTSMGIAYAFVNSWLSVYKDSWCTFLSTQMHEIGHNIGLAHR